MKILIVGNGGREHALLWKLRRDAPDAEFYITRGNGGTDGLAKALPMDASEIGSLAGYVESRGIELTVIGPEAPLAAGIVDAFSARGLPVFGPTAAAAAIESSKSFAKKTLTNAGVPTAAYACFTDIEKAEHYILERGGPAVVKASGLAAGKGAVVCASAEEAVAAARAMLGGALGDAGAEIVVEEVMEGEELSVFAICDGYDALLMLPAQDHKRIGEGDTGANTGGMGAYAPVSLTTPGLLRDVREKIFLPTLAQLREHNRPFRGLLYAGLMLTRTGPRVVEFNARFGDPETQAILPLLESSLLAPMLAVARGERLPQQPLEWRAGAALTTVLAAAGYPGSYPTGLPVEIPASLAQRDDVIVFHAGTRMENGQLLTSGGRVLAVTGLGADMSAAAQASRDAAQEIAFEGKQYRRDIGWRELARHA